MQKYKFVLLFFLLPFLAPAQSANYDRPTVNFILVKHGDELDAAAEKVFRSLRPEDKFYSNNLGLNALNLPKLKRENQSPAAWQEVLKGLERERVAHKEIAAWYNVQKDTFLNMKVIHTRSEVNATDENLHIAAATKRGIEELKNAGSKLIPKTFVIVLDYLNATYSADRMAQVHYWNSIVRAYVFQLNYNESIEESIYDCWIYDEDSPEVKAEKKERFAKLPFTMNYVTQVSVRQTSSGLLSSSGGAMGANSGIEQILRASMRVMSRNELLTEMYQSGYKLALNELEKQVVDFKVTSGITNVEPIRAKIGRKEGLKTDHRYYVNEYQVDKNGKVSAKRKGVIRAGKKVVDNRGVTKGETPESHFYQIAGGKLENGMTLVQKNDAGLSFNVGYTALDFKHGGWRIGMDMLTNKLINTGLPSLLLFVDMEFDNVDYQLKNSSFVDSYSFWRVSGGIGKGFYFWRNFCLQPQLGFGYENTSVGNLALETLYFKGAINLSLNLFYPLALVGGVGAHYYLAPSFESNSSLLFNNSLNSYKDVFPARSSFMGITYLGIKISF
ncbi:MAG: hypothetical protein ACRCSB_03750 [Bacteroidales bacterium]